MKQKNDYSTFRIDCAIIKTIKLLYEKKCSSSKKFFVAIIFRFFLFSSQVKAQNTLTITGKITNENGDGVPNATIRVKGANNQTISLQDGSYKLSGVKGNDVLVFSSVGYLDQEIPVNNRTVIDLALDISQKILGEVVVIGYGSIKRKEVTGAVSSFDAKTG